MFTRVILQYAATRDIKLATHKGNLIRSAIGAALKRLDEGIAYRWLFEGWGLHDAFGGMGIVDLPRKPIPMFAPESFSEKTDFAPGDELSFGVVLFAPTLTWMFFQPAFQMMFTGFGFELQGVFIEDDGDYSGQTLLDPGTEALPEWSLQDAIDYYGIDSPVKQLTIHLRSPLRLFRGGKLVREPGFADVVHACVRRIKQLAPVETISSMIRTGHQPGELNLDMLDELARMSENVESHSKTEWLDWRRIRSADKKPMMMGGAAGTITATGDDLAPFVHLLGMGELLHIGKATTMGNGIFSFGV